MVFFKTGDATVQTVYCACGGEIVEGKCSKCGKTYNQDEKEKKDGQGQGSVTDEDSGTDGSSGE